jgi:hypothetical protein
MSFFSISGCPREAQGELQCAFFNFLIATLKMSKSSNEINFTNAFYLTHYVTNIIKPTLINIKITETFYGLDFILSL